MRRRGRMNKQQNRKKHEDLLICTGYMYYNVQAEEIGKQQYQK
jgi:hypothetical protein